MKLYVVSYFSSLTQQRELHSIEVVKEDALKKRDALVKLQVDGKIQEIEVEL